MISIIITTKNEEKRIGRLLRSIFNQSYKKFEIIIVDNNSSDRTKEIGRSFSCRVYNIGPERSVQRNFGVQKAKGESVLILDADMVLTKGVLFELSKIKEQIVIIPEKSFGVGVWAQFKVFEREFYVGDESIEAPRYFLKKLFLEYGGYDEKITGPEDFDLPLRIKKAGIKIGRINSFILHDEGKFSPIKSAKKKFYYATHARVFLKRHPEQVFTTGNLIFRPVFFKKWKKLISHPILSLGMIIIKVVEGFGALAGVIYSAISDIIPIK